MKKKTKKTKRIKLTPLPKLMEQTHALVSKYVRLRDKRCVLCGSTENLCAGHCFKRGKKIITFDLRNVNCLCKSCNWKDNFFHDPYVAWMLKTYGEEVYQELFDKVQKFPSYKYSRRELENIQLSFKLLLE